jgi:hypothetical protein
MGMTTEVSPAANAMRTPRSTDETEITCFCNSRLKLGCSSDTFSGQRRPTLGSRWRCCFYECRQSGDHNGPAMSAVMIKALPMRHSVVSS